MSVQYSKKLNQKVSFGATDNAVPTFGGITGLSANANGSLTASWSAATDTSLPISYRVYIQAGSATGLFAPANLALAAFELSYTLYHLPDSSCLVEGSTYYVGVRAVDAVGNETTNTQTQHAVSSGVYTNNISTAINSITTITKALGNISSLIVSEVE